MHNTQIVQHAEESEQQLIERAQTALSRCNWTIGECASKWCKVYARGRTDADFAEMIGMDRSQVAQRRLVFETFADICDTYHTLSFSHFYAALNWDDAADCLQWAHSTEATVAEMKAYRRLQCGSDATDDSEPLGQPLGLWGSCSRDPGQWEHVELAEELKLRPPAERDEPREAPERKTPARRSQHDQDEDFRRAMDAIDLIVDRITDEEDRRAVAQRLRAAADRLEGV